MEEIDVPLRISCFLFGANREVDGGRVLEGEYDFVFLNSGASLRYSKEGLRCSEEAWVFVALPFVTISKEDEK